LILKPLSRLILQYAKYLKGYTGNDNLVGSN